MDSNPWDADKMLKRYIYDYLIKKNLHVTAQTFKQEVDIPLGPVVIDDSRGGFLSEWWQIFSDFYLSRMNNNSGNPPTTNEVSRMAERWSNGREATGAGSSHRRSSSSVLRKPPPLQVGGSSLASFRTAMAKEDNMLHQQLDEERWAGLPEYLRCMLSQSQNSSSNLVGRNLQPVGMQRPQQMEFKRPRVTSSVQVQPFRPQKINMPVIGLPDPAPFDAAPLRPANPAPPYTWPPNVLSRALMPRNQGQQFQPLSYQEEQNLIQKALPQAQQGIQPPKSFIDPALFASLRGGVSIGAAQKADARCNAAMTQREASMEMITRVHPGSQAQKDHLKGKQVEESTGKRKEPSYAESQSSPPLIDIEALSYINLSPEHVPYYASVPVTLTDTLEFIQSRDFFNADKNKKLAQRSKPPDNFIDLNDISLEDHVEDLFFTEGEMNENAKTSLDDLIDLNDVSLEAHMENMLFPEEKNENAKTSSDDLIVLNDVSLEDQVKHCLFPGEEKNESENASSLSKYSSKESEGEKNENGKSPADSKHSSEEYAGEKNENTKTQSDDSKHSSTSTEESEGERNENAKTQSDSKHSSTSTEKSEGEKNEKAKTQSDSTHSSHSTDDCEGDKIENAKSSSASKNSSASTEDSEGEKNENSNMSSDSKHGSASIEESEGKKSETAMASPDSKPSSPATEENKDAAKDHVPEEKDEELQ